MHNNGDIVSLLVDKTEGAGPGSLNVRAGITGMIVNAGRACRPGDYSYIVDFGPEGQWNCVHDELRNLMFSAEDEEDSWDESDDEELQQDITEEEAARMWVDENELVSVDPDLATVEERTVVEISPLPGGELFPSPNKKISFEADLARISKEIEKGIK